MADPSAESRRNLDRVERHYGRYDESKRFDHALCELELVRTKEIVARELGTAPRVVIDVGGGPGVYTRWLLEAGHTVHLVDPVARHVEQATAVIEELGAGARASARQGHALDLDFADASADVVLLLGPLYHLTARDDRLAALAEARRVLRPGGTIFAAAISRFASLIDGLRRNLVRDPVFVEMLRRDLAEGQHRNPTGNVDYFTDAFFHLPEELGAELGEIGFAGVRVLGVEGPAAADPDFERHWTRAEFRELLLELLRTCEAEGSLIGASPHLLAVGRVPL